MTVESHATNATAIEKLRSFMASRHLSQKAMAERMGISQSALSKILAKDAAEIGPRTLRHIARGLQTSVESLQNPEGSSSETQTSNSFKKEFDCFISHQSEDTEIARQLCEHLRSCGSRVWLAEDELSPGLPWRQVLEAGLMSSRAIAVLIGANGLGPLVDLEMRRMVNHALSEHRVVVPILIPGAPPTIEMPPVLRNLLHIDLRSGATEESLNRVAMALGESKFESAAPPVIRPSASIPPPPSPPPAAAPLHPSTSIPHNLPALQPFFGREDELRKIADALDPDSRTWGALIDGPGGMGKTSLAVRAAYDASPDVFKKIIFISLKTRELDDDGVRDLSGFILSGLVELLNELARELGCDDIAKAPEDQRPRLLLDKLRGTQTLLVLDNLESLLKRERDTLFTFVKKLPAGCKAILTSRGRIGSGAEELILEALSQEAALATLAELATHNPILARTNEAERLVLYRETAGKPLLLRWTAGQLGRGHCLTFTDALHFLRSCPEGNDPLEFTFGDIVEDFDAAETKALWALTYFTLPVKVEHIAAIASPPAAIAGPLPVAEVERALRSLSNRSLVVPTDEFQSFTLVPMVADFLRKKKPEVMAETGEMLEKRAYALIIDNGYDKHARFPELEAAWAGIAPALPLFLAGDNARLQTVCDALMNFLNFQGRWDEGLALCQKAEARAVAAADHEMAGWRAYHAGIIHSLRRQADAMLTCAERAAAHWAESRAGAREQAFAIRLRGIGHELKTEYRAAITAYCESLNLHRSRAAESVDVAIGLNDLANARKISGDFDVAERNYREALRVARKLGFDEGVAIYTGNLAELFLDLKDWPAAEALAREALPLSEAVHRQDLIAANNARLAHALVRQGKAAEALPHAGRAVEIYTRLGSPDVTHAQAILAECEQALAE